MQESKLEVISGLKWKEISGSRLDQFAFLPSVGSSGGIIMGWNSVLLVGNEVRRGVFCLTIDFISKTDDLRWRCTSVYGPNARQLKRAFWEELRGCCGDPGVPWVICGDSNAIFSLEDKWGGNPNLADIRDANTLLHDLYLHEPPVMGRRFTWTNGQEIPILFKLDRFQVNRACVDRFLLSSEAGLGSCTYQT